MIDPSPPEVSAVIPTLNSERTIESCLRSLKAQKPSTNLETIVVDSHSSDNTVRLAQAYGPKLITTTQKLLGARLRGIEASTGRFVLFLDSDQVLAENAVERACSMMNDLDMLILEEFSGDPSTFLQRIFSRERRLTRQALSKHMDPRSGVLLPRFFKRELLRKAAALIPPSLADFVVAHDHAIIYFESAKFSRRIGVVPNAIYHSEPRSVLDLWRKNFRYGVSTAGIARSGYYGPLLKRNLKVRAMGSHGSFGDWAASTVLLALKAIPYQIGFVEGLSETKREPAPTVVPEEA